MDKPEDNTTVNVPTADNHSYKPEELKTEVPQQPVDPESMQYISLTLSVRDARDLKSTLDNNRDALDYLAKKNKLRSDPTKALEFYTRMSGKLQSRIQEPNPMFYLNDYRLTREYGGPEEGGWYWDCCSCVFSRGFFSLREAYDQWEEALTYTIIDRSDALEQITYDYVKDLSTAHDHSSADASIIQWYCKDGGENHMLCIEREPAAQQDTRKPLWDE